MLSNEATGVKSNNSQQNLWSLYGYQTLLTQTLNHAVLLYASEVGNYYHLPASGEGTFPFTKISVPKLEFQHSNLSFRAQFLMTILT